MRPVVENSLAGDHHVLLGSDHSTRVRIGVDPWEVAARDVEPDPVAGGEDIARDLHIDVELVHLARDERRRLGPAVAKARPDDALTEVEGGAVGMRLDEARAVKSVSRAVLEAKSVAVTRPVTSSDAASGSEV